MNDLQVALTHRTFFNNGPASSWSSFLPVAWVRDG
jgi:hypothetical protein